ncbi:hypothetical protein GCM10011415_32970 [Salipiger pallidus]|uniref:Uncharacterized protein n=1 Tax=Salipiger pallidus TaxID=1775170 RepID=A0A8J2ZM50_9RHOB|nr:hypothetical protein GCM10011415_32970 [Salipiger pallidus]
MRRFELQRDGQARRRGQKRRGRQKQRGKGRAEDGAGHMGSPCWRRGGASVVNGSDGPSVANSGRYSSA